MKDILDKLDNIINEGMLGDMANACEADHEVQMARADLFKIAKYSIKLHDMMKNVSEMQGIEGWQQAKITKAADYLSSVYHNLDYEMSPLNQAEAGADTDKVMAQMAYDMAANDDIEEDKVPMPPKRPEQKKAASYSDAQRKSMDDAVHDISLSAEEEDAKKRKNESADLGRATRKFSDWGRK